MGPFCLKIRADSSQLFQTYGQKRELAKLCRACATCRTEDNPESYSKQYKSPTVGRRRLEVIARMLKWLNNTD